MKSIFPKSTRNLPEINIPFNGAKGYLVQVEKKQVILMEIEKDVIVPEHSHGNQWEIVLEGKIDYW